MSREVRTAIRLATVGIFLLLFGCTNLATQREESSPAGVAADPIEDGDEVASATAQSPADDTKADTMEVASAEGFSAHRERTEDILDELRPNHPDEPLSSLPNKPGDDLISVTPGTQIHATLRHGSRGREAPIPRAESIKLVPGRITGGKELWARIRAGLKLAVSDRAEVQQEIEWFRTNKGYITRSAKRARPYLYLMTNEIEGRGLPLDLVLLPIVESAYKTDALSPKAASGLWQFIPSTGTHFGLKQDDWYDGRQDVMASTRAACKYLESLYKRFDGDWLLALASYNWGENNVEKALQKNREQGLPLDFWSLKVPKETARYVPKLLALSKIVLDPTQYGVKLKTIPNGPLLLEVQAKQQIDLGQVADQAGLEIQTLKSFNPGIKLDSTHPEGPHKLLVPVPNAKKLANSSAYSVIQPPLAGGDYHRVRQGDTLSTIARRYGTTAAALQQANKLPGTLIRVGEKLRIPGRGAGV